MPNTPGVSKLFSSIDGSGGCVIVGGVCTVVDGGDAPRDT